MTALLVACARTPNRQESAPPPRVKDTVPEKAAAHKAASPGLQLEAQDERWGIEAAQERKRQEQEKKAAATGGRDGGAAKQVTPLPAAR
jgi:hypothetical protein